MRLFNVALTYSDGCTMYRIIVAPSLDAAKQLHNTNAPAYVPDAHVESEHWSDFGPVPEAGKIVDEEYTGV